MNVDNLLRSARLMWRADRLIAHVQFQHMITNLILLMLAAMIVFFALLMLEVAGYFAILQNYGAIFSALALSGVNVVLALAVFLFAKYRKIGKELRLAIELHNSAATALQSDLAPALTAINGLRQATSHPLDSVLAALILPSVEILMKVFRATRGRTGRPSTAAEN